MSVEDEAFNCSLDFESRKYKVLAGLKAGVGLISALCCLAVITIIILLKRYKLFSQRLILNVAVAAFIHSLSYTTERVNYYTHRPVNDSYCYFAGPFTDYSQTVELISIWFVVINIFSVGIFKKNISRCEYLYYILTYTLPCLWLWVPIWKKLYGTNMVLCSIRTINETNCEDIKTGIDVQLGIWFIPLCVSTAVMLAMLVAVPIKVTCSIRLQKNQHNPVARAARNTVLSQIRPLIAYPVLYLLMNSFSIASRLYDDCTPGPPSLILEYFHVFTSPLRGGFIALVFIWNRDTWRRLRSGEWRVQWRRKHKQPQHIEQEIESTTVYAEHSSETDPLLGESQQKIQ